MLQLGRRRRTLIGSLADFRAGEQRRRFPRLHAPELVPAVEPM